MVDSVRAERQHMMLVAASFSATPPIVAFLAGLITDVGSRAAPAFPTVLAQIVPVLFLAALIENRTSITRFVKEWGHPGDVEIARGQVNAQVGLFLVAEATALYAVAADMRTTFLLFTPCIAMLFMLWFMVGSLMEYLITTTRDTE